MAQPDYTLYYFDVRGLAEPIRLIFKLKSIPFTDHRIPFNMPPVIPPEIKELCPFGQVPILKIGDDEILSQSMTILRYLARKYELIGSTELEGAKCEELADGVRDYWQLFFPIFREENEDKKKEMIETAVEKGRVQYLNKFNQILLDSEGANDEGVGHLVGKDLTWADIYVAYVVDNIATVFDVDLTSEFPALKNLIKLVFQTPEIAAWIAERPQSKF